ncbi:MAG: SDR family NAD(P)-dependent oxidoreductase [Candidatus Kapaibacteriota bacterium]
MNKTVLITGASKGIGKALAIQFAKNNWDLIITSRNLEKLNILRTEIINQFNVQCQALTLDVTDLNAFSKVLDVFSFDKIDLIILNAGISYPFNFKQEDFEKARLVFETNFFGVLNGLQTFIPFLEKQGYGKIAIVSSLADAKGFPGASVYAASKSAVSFISSAARTALKNKNIEIITIKPGFVKTDLIVNGDFPILFALDADKAAEIIYNGIQNNRKRIYFPFSTSILSYILKLIPSFIFEFLAKPYIKER